MRKATHGRGDSKGAGVRGAEDGGAGNGEERRTEEDGETKGEGDAKETEERRERCNKRKGQPEERGAASPFFLGLTHALHGTQTHQTLTFPPGRAGRERQLSGRVREVPFKTCGESRGACPLRGGTRARGEAA